MNRGLTEGSFIPLYFFQEFACLEGFVTFRECGDLNQPAIKKRFLQKVGISENCLTSAEQIHGNNVAIVNREQVGKRLTSVDGLITKLKRVPFAIFTADCLTIFIFCPDKNIITLLHAGWRGTVKGIVPNGLACLRKEFGVNLKKAKVIFGPYIHPCCYRVKWDPVIKEARAFLKDEKYFHLYCKNIKNDLWAFDLGGVNQHYLERAGIPDKNISDMGICTYEDKRTFSYRREGESAGRMMSLIMME